MTARTGARVHGAVFTCVHRVVRARCTGGVQCVHCALCTNRVCNRGAPTVQPCAQNQRNRALSRLRQPPELSRHGLDSSTRRAHSCSWPLRLKHDGSHGRARARCGFHVCAQGSAHRARTVGDTVCTVQRAVCARCMHRPCNRRCETNATERRRGSGGLPSCPDTIRIALLGAHTVAVDHSG